MLNILHKIAAFNKTNANSSIVKTAYNKHILGVDHIAFRSLYKGMNTIDPSIYEKKSEVYNFPEYNVKANEYYKTNKNAKDYPLRVFSSHYAGEHHYSSRIRKMIHLLKTNEFGEMYSYDDYLQIYNWNQYMAWTMIHKDAINHIAFQVDDLEKVTNTMIKDGFTFFQQSSGGALNISPDGNLLQSSHVSIKKLYKFTDGYYNVPYSFLEFVERRNGREGFSESNANQIMHSTKNI